MWRAYGDVAFVMNNKPFAAVTDRLGAFSMPVQYLDQATFDATFMDLAKAFSKNTDSLQLQGDGEAALVEGAPKCWGAMSMRLEIRQTRRLSSVRTGW